MDIAVGDTIQATKKATVPGLPASRCSGRYGFQDPLHGLRQVRSMLPPARCEKTSRKCSQSPALPVTIGSCKEEAAQYVKDCFPKWRLSATGLKEAFHPLGSAGNCVGSRTVTPFDAGYHEARNCVVQGPIRP